MSNSLSLRVVQLRDHGAPDNRWNVFLFRGDEPLEVFTIDGFATNMLVWWGSEANVRSRADRLLKKIHSGKGRYGKRMKGASVPSVEFVVT